MTTSPRRPPQNPYSGQPAGYGPPPGQFPQYTERPGKPDQDQYGGQPPYAERPQAPHQQQGGQGQFPQQGFAPDMQGTQQCRICGGFPAVNATVRGLQGLVVEFHFPKVEGPFCRICGIATVRDMTSKALWQGWWCVASPIVNPIIVLMNLVCWLRFKALAEPGLTRGQPMNPGKPLIRRLPAILSLLIPLAVVCLIVVVNLRSAAESAVGNCVVNKGTNQNPDVTFVDCSSPDAQYRIIGKLDGTTDSTRCREFPGYEASYTWQKGSSRYTLCLTPV